MCRHASASKLTFSHMMAWLILSRKPWSPMFIRSRCRRLVPFFSKQILKWLSIIRKRSLRYEGGNEENRRRIRKSQISKTNQIWMTRPAKQRWKPKAQLKEASRCRSTKRLRNSSSNLTSSIRNSTSSDDRLQVVIQWHLGENGPIAPRRTS